MKRLSLCLILLVALLATQGCTYVKDRYHDTCDLADIGFTFSKDPHFAAFVDAPFLTIYPIGWGIVDGTYLGLGGGRPGFFAPHYQQNWGVVLYGEEMGAWGYGKEDLLAINPDLKARDDKELNKAREFYRTGIGGFIHGPFPHPDFLVSCPHFLHLGWVGVMANPRYWEMADWTLGWLMIDINLDDEMGPEMNDDDKGKFFWPLGV